MPCLPQELVLKKASKIRLFISDVDGVLTDGKITYLETGQELMSFSVLDGLGIRLLMENGVDFAVLTGRSNAATERRVQELGITHVVQGVKDKLKAYQVLKSLYRLEDKEIACIGDDLQDLPILKLAGLSIAVPNSTSQVRDMAHYITKRKGGEGAIREVCELILKAKDLWDTTLSRFLNPE